jgi:hypothetical protein
MPATNDTCETALVVPVGSYTGTTVGAANDYTGGTNCAGTAGLDVVYAIDVPAGQRIVATVRNTGDTFDPSISLLAAAACAATPRVCLSGDDSGGASTVNTARWLNETGATARVFAVVDSFRSADTGGAFVLELALETPPAGDRCSSATLITAGTTSGTTVGATNDYGTGTNCAGTAGADVTYAIDVPAGQRATVTVTSGDGTFDPSISLVAGPGETCGGSPRVCLAGDDSGAATTVNSAQWVNGAASSTRIFAVVDSASSTATGPFTLTLAFDTPPAGDVCGSAATLTPGTVMGSTVGATNDYGAGTGCAGTAGLDFVHALDVPPGQRAVVTVTSGDGTFDPSISLVAGPAATCGGSPRTCLAGDDSGTASTVNVVRWTNTGGSAATVFAVVDSASPSAAGPYTLTYAVEPAPAGEYCGIAQRITPGTVMDTLVGYTNDFGSGTGCAGTSGVDRVYVISVGPGQTLEADVTSGDGSFDPSISLELACGATPRTCVAGDDSGLASTVNSVTYTNMGASAQDVFIVIDTFSSTSMGGPFTMSTRLMR